MSKFFQFIIVALIIGVLGCQDNQANDQSTISETIEDSLDESTPSLNIENSKYFPEDIATLFFDNEAHYVNTNGQILEFPYYDQYDGLYNILDNFSEGLTVVSERHKDGSAYKFTARYADVTGRIVIDETFNFAFSFKNGYAVVLLADSDKWSLINKNGDHILEAGGIQMPYGDVAWIRDYESWALAKIDTINLSYELLTDFDYIITGNFKEGICWVENFNNQRAFMNTEGEIISPWFENACDLRNNLATFQLNQKWGAVNNKGHIILQAKFDYISDFSEGYSAFCNFKNGDFDKWGYINEQGEVMIDLQFGWTNEFINGFAQVREDNSEGLRGFINKKGELVIDYQFDRTYNFYEGYAAVQKDNKFGFIDTTGELVIDYQFDEISPFPDDALTAGFSGGVSKVRVNGEEFFIDTNGNCIIGCE